MKQKAGAIILFALLVCLLAAGCKGEKGQSDKKFSDDKDVTVTWWLMGGTDQYYQYYWKEMKALQKIQEITGINIDFQVAINYDAYLPMMTAKTYPEILTAKNNERYAGRRKAGNTTGW